MNWKTFHTILFAILAVSPMVSSAQSVAEVKAAGQIQAIEIQGVVEIKPVGTTNWMTAQVGQILLPTEHLRTGPDSRVSCVGPTRA